MGRIESERSPVQTLNEVAYACYRPSMGIRPCAQILDMAQHRESKEPTLLGDAARYCLMVAIIVGIPVIYNQMSTSPS